MYVIDREDTSTNRWEGQGHPPRISDTTRETDLLTGNLFAKINNVFPDISSYYFLSFLDCVENINIKISKGSYFLKKDIVPLGGSD